MASDVLVSTEWVANNLDKVKLIEVDVDTNAYDEGHAPGAVGFNWTSQLQDQTRRDVITKEGLEELLSNAGVSNGDTIVLYGDNNNWFAAYAFWQLKYYGHKDVRLVNGGRKKWLAERRPLTAELPKITPVTYRAAVRLTRWRLITGELATAPNTTFIPAGRAISDTVSDLPTSQVPAPDSPKP
jgi:thiosulfate/3-mercaptopyruvate sulfurtransferase